MTAAGKVSPAKIRSDRIDVARMRRADCPPGHSRRLRQPHTATRPIRRRKTLRKSPPNSTDGGRPCSHHLVVRPRHRLTSTIRQRRTQRRAARRPDRAKYLLQMTTCAMSRPGHMRCHAALSAHRCPSPLRKITKAPRHRSQRALAGHLPNLTACSSFPRSTPRRCSLSISDVRRRSVISAA